MNYTFQKMTTRAWSWTRMKIVKQYYWICIVKLFGKTELIAYSGETVHNKDDRDAGLDNFIVGIKKGNYTIKDLDKEKVDKS